MPIRTPRGPSPLVRRCLKLCVGASASPRFDRVIPRRLLAAALVFVIAMVAVEASARADDPPPAASAADSAGAAGGGGGAGGTEASAATDTGATDPRVTAPRPATPADATPVASAPAPAPRGIPPDPASPVSGRASAHSTPSTPVTPPTDLHDLDAWIAYRAHAQIPMLPSEARLFHRRGLIALKSGQDAEGVRLLRGAATLDPTFLSPHAMLASWFMTREPSTALQECAAALQLLRRDFLLQLDLAANAVFYLLTVLFLGLVGAGVLVVAVHHASLRHMWQERLGRRLTPTTARLWPWLVLTLSFVVGLGLVMPVLVFMGMLWPVLRMRERFLAGTLALAVTVAPFAPVLIGRLALPLHDDSAPFFGVASIEHDPWTPEQQRRLTRLAGSIPDNPFVAFGLGWSARHGEDLATAERAYRQVLQHWPDDDRALVNLGNILAVQGRFDDALALYDRALKARPDNAAAWFDQSQVYTRQFDYRRASESVSRASALDFDLVQRLQGASVGGALPLADQWIAPRTFWLAMRSALAGRAAEPAIPPSWRGTVEVTIGWFGPVALLLMLGAIVLGYAWQRGLPLRTCSNCGVVVCRRCAQRRREVALCPACAAAESRAESADFGRVLLAQQRRRIEHGRRTVRTAIAALVPGFGFATFHDVFSLLSVTMLVAGLVLVALGVTPPFDSRHDFGLAGPGVPIPVIFTLWVVAYGVSILRFVARQAKLDASADMTPVKSRATQATHRREEAA